MAHRTILPLRLVILTVLLMAWRAPLLAQPGEAGLLRGTPIGSTNIDYSTNRPSDTKNTLAHAFDGDYNTFYASYDRSRTWVGLDLGSPHVITRIGWCPRTGQSHRVQLGVFEGSNREDFLDAVPLYLIPGKGTDRLMEYAEVQVSRGFRYVRYVGPNDVRCNIGELEFYGYEGEGDNSRFYQVTNLPTVSIHTYCGYDPQNKVDELESNVTITYDGGTRIQEYPITVRGRGNASWGFPKKPYRIKFNDGKSHHMLKGSAQESPAKAKKWTLINNYGDKTLMRNIVAFEFSKRLGMPYTTYCQPVDVIMNGEYKGCYQLCDQITPDPQRVPITEMEPTDVEEPHISGGYLVEIDAYAGQEPETSRFYSTRGMPVTIKAPSENDIVPAQKQYIRNAFNQMEARVWSSKYKDEEEGYRSRLDVESFLKHFIVGEFSGNTDTYWSTYMYKDRQEDVFTVAPAWDFDLAFNNDNRIYPVCNRTNWVFRSGGSCASGMSSFVSRILNDSYADTRLKEIWRDARRSGAFSQESLVAFVDSIAEALDASQKLNFTRWPILNSIVHQNPRALGSFDAEVNVLRSYIPERIQWIDDFLGYFEAPKLKGDVNGDGALTSADIDLMEQHLMGETPGTFAHDNADINGDGKADMVDMVLLNNLIEDKGHVSGSISAHFYTSNTSVKAGGTRQLYIYYEASETPSAFMFDLTLDDHLFVDPANVKPGSVYSETHRTLIRQLDDHTLRFIAYSPSNAALKNSTGRAFAITLSGDEAFTGGNFRLTNQMMVSPVGKSGTADNATYTVTLAKTYVSSILLDTEEVTLTPGSQYTFTPTIMPELATQKTLKWTTSNAQVATVDERGTVSALTTGEALIYAAATDGSNVKQQATVKVESADGIMTIADVPQGADVYTLTGLKVARVQHGRFYIINGKKVFIK